METLQLKTAFHQLIDEFEDIEVLVNFYQLIYAYQLKNQAKDIIDQLSSKQQARLYDSLKQSEEMTHLLHNSLDR
jgi:hypothetical protein